METSGNLIAWHLTSKMGSNLLAVYSDFSLIRIFSVWTLDWSIAAAWPWPMSKITNKKIETHFLKKKLKIFGISKIILFLKIFKKKKINCIHHFHRLYSQITRLFLQEILANYSPRNLSNFLFTEPLI